MFLLLTPPPSPLHDIEHVVIVCFIIIRYNYNIWMFFALFKTFNFSISLIRFSLVEIFKLTTNQKTGSKLRIEDGYFWMETGIWTCRLAELLLTINLSPNPHPHVMSSLPALNPNQTISQTLPLYLDKGKLKQWNILLSERWNPWITLQSIVNST